MLRRVPRLSFGLRGKILALGLAGVVVVSAIFMLGMQLDQQSRATAEQFSRLAASTGRLSEGLLQGRQIATEFLQKPTDAKITTHNEVLKRSAGSLDEIEQFVATLPADDPLRQASSFRSGINMYTTQFSNVVAAQKLLGFNEEQGLQGKLRGAVHSVESRLKQLDQPRLAVLMLMMRRHEKDFMLRGDEKYGDELKKRVGEFAAEMKKTDIPQAAQAEISKLIDVYQSSFIAFMTGQTSLNEEAADLAQTYGRLRPSLVAVRQAADDKLASLQSELAQRRLIRARRNRACRRGSRHCRAAVRAIAVAAPGADRRQHAATGAGRSRIRDRAFQAHRRNRNDHGRARGVPRQADREPRNVRGPESPQSSRPTPNGGTRCTRWPTSSSRRSARSCEPCPPRPPRSKPPPTD